MDDFKDWRKNLLRFLSLGSVNILLLFALGLKKFLHLVNSTMSWSDKPYIWLGNNSIKAVISMATNSKKLAAKLPSVSELLLKAAPLLEVIILLAFLASLAFILWVMAKNKMPGLNPYLIFACIIGSLIIPAESHDYRLAILAGPLALLFTSKHKGCMQDFIIFCMSLFYSSTMWYWWEKKAHSQIFRLNFPSLVALFILLFILMRINERKSSA